ncbi:unnamed protein product [Closterium sp. NIES-53]
MAGNTSAGAGESSAQDRSGSQDSGVSATRGARTNQGSLIKEVLKNFTVEKFNGVDRVEGAARPDLRCRNVDAGEGAVRVAFERGRAGATCFGQMRDLYAKLATAGITYPEQTKCLKMLSLLPESWLQFTSGLSLPQNQSLWTLEWVRTKILEEDFRRCQLRGGDDGSSGYEMQGSKRGRGRGFGGAGRGAKKDDDSNDQQGGTGWGRGAKSGRGGKSGAGGKMKGSCWYCEKEGHPWFLCYKKPDG